MGDAPGGEPNSSPPPDAPASLVDATPGPVTPPPNPNANVPQPVTSAPSVSQQTATASGCTQQCALRACEIPSGGTDCLLPAAVSCISPTTIKHAPPPGQPGYGFHLELKYSAAGGTALLEYEVYETGIRADGSVAWSGPHSTGTSAVSSCNTVDLKIGFASGLGEKIRAGIRP